MDHTSHPKKPKERNNDTNRAVKFVNSRPNGNSDPINH